VQQDLPALDREAQAKSRPAFDNRQIVNGILWRIRTGAPWRELPEKYGKWMTVYQRFRRWGEAGIWVAVAKARPGLDWAAFHFNPPGEIQLYEPNAKMRIDEYEFFRSGRAKVLMDEAVFTTLLKRSLVSSESGRGER
jgi:hypothetical protein